MMRLISSARISIDASPGRAGGRALSWGWALLLQLLAEVLELRADASVVDEAPDLRDDAAEEGRVDRAVEQDLGAVLARQLVGDRLHGLVVELHGGGDLRAQPAEVAVGELAEGVDDRRQVREAVAVAEEEEEVRRLGVELQGGGELLDDRPALLLRVDRVREDVAEVRRGEDRLPEGLEALRPRLDTTRLDRQAEERLGVAARDGTDDHRGRAT